MILAERNRPPSASTCVPEKAFADKGSFYTQKGIFMKQVTFFTYKKIAHFERKKTNQKKALFSREKRKILIEKRGYESVKKGNLLSMIKALLSSVSEKKGLSF